VADEDRLLDAERVEDAGRVGDEVLDAVGLAVGRRVAVAVAALVGDDDAEARVGDRADLLGVRKRFGVGRDRTSGARAVRARGGGGLVASPTAS
jgi:hypothetical protein